ncbi:MAG TPA: RidA family protein [Tepidisphaeraceae bacterium]|nr:RidA family protein [Tepidisphaeraceae bacterium]
MHPIDQKLAELQLVWPAPPKPVASYVPCVRSGNLIYVSGQLPMKEGQLMATGKVPSAVNLEAAQAAARQCVLNGLSIVRNELGGDWNRLVRVVRLGVFVQCDDEFTQQPQVANGASDLLQQILGEQGRHARAALGTNALPLGATVEVEMLVEIN